MRWTPLQLMLPVLIGMSLTGVSLGILYLLIEKDEKKSRGDKEAKGIRTGFASAEVRVPREFVPAIIGRGGSMIKSIESTTSTRIHFADDNSDLPYRICHLKGTTEGLRMAEAMINNMIASQPLIETYETYVSQRVCPKIIGRAGETINKIQLSSKAKILIDRSYSHNPTSKRRVIIKGTAEQIASALSQIEDKVHEYNDTLEKLVVRESLRSPRGKISPRIAAVNPSGDNRLLSQPGDDQSLHEGTMEVYVSAVETPSQFWVQVAGAGTLSLDDLVAEMTAYYENEENRELHVLKNITVGQTVAAKFLFDGKWYRAEVTSALDDGECEVYFLDYGDHEVVAIKDILELRTDFLSLRLQAIECSLANVKPRGIEWSPEACDRFSDLTWVAQWKVLIAKVRGYKERTMGRGSSRREGSPIPCVDLYDKNDDQDINIGKQLVAENFAEAEEGVWSAASSTLSLSRRSNDNPTSPVPVSPPSSVHSKSELPTTPENSEPMKNGKVVAEVDLTTPRVPKEKPKAIEEVDLTTPRKSLEVVEEVDLVTPVKTATTQFIDAERSEGLANGGGDADRERTYENGDRIKENGKSNSSITTVTKMAPPVYNDVDDESEDSGEFTLEEEKKKKKKQRILYRFYGSFCVTNLT